MASLKVQGRVSKLILKPLLVHSSQSPISNVLCLNLRRLSSTSLEDDDDDNYNDTQQQQQRRSPPEPIPNRPLRGENQNQRPNNIPFREPNRGKFDLRNLAGDNKKRVVGDQAENNFLDRFRLGLDDINKPKQVEQEQGKVPPPVCDNAQERSEATPPLPEDSDEIFKILKETGLIPNAVAMLDGLCKDGLVQEAMKLFGSMREKGTIPEVVIYTAVVEGFCKAHKFDDAKRIFRKMQNNGISPNAFSYTILIQGFYKCNKLDEAIDFCLEMLEAGHSPNVTTIVGLVDCLCKEKGVEEAQAIIGTFKQKGIFINEKAVIEFLNKKGPHSPLVWEAIFGKKTSESQTSF